jgi:tRNA pseudouridine55 synthase
MSRRKSGKAINGIVLLDKPSGITSNRALQTVRRMFDARKGGHTGSLDPFATGMLPLCFGEASKTAAFMIDSDKSYRATARLGITTDSGDVDGQVTSESAVPELSAEQISEVFSQFVGEIEQVPPMYSALKHQGQPLYKLARQGKTVERKPRKVVIHDLKFLSLDEPLLEFEVACSKGTYIRTLAEDIAKALGSCAHLAELRRLHVEPFDAGGMVTMEQLEASVESGQLEQHLLPLDAGLPDWPVIRLNSQDTAGFHHGRILKVENQATGWVRVYGPDDQAIGLAESTSDGLLKPKRVFRLEGQE